MALYQDFQANFHQYCPPILATWGRYDTVEAHLLMTRTDHDAALSDTIRAARNL